MRTLYKTAASVAAVFAISFSSSAETRDSVRVAGIETVSGEMMSRSRSNAITGNIQGILKGVHSREYSGNVGLEADFRLTARAGLAPAIMMDGVPVDISMESLDAEEIESISFISDIAAKAIYGPWAANGVLDIRLKKGRPGKPTVRIAAESGADFVDRFPQWADGYEYATFKNAAYKAGGLAMPYDEFAVKQFALGLASDQFYPSVDYRKLMLKETRSFSKANLTVNGGEKGFLYNAYLGWRNQGEIYRIGSDAATDQFNVGTDISARINHALSVDARFRASYRLTDSPIYGTSKEDILGSVITDVNTFSPVELPILVDVANGQEGAEPQTGYGVTMRENRNPYADLAERGFYKEKRLTIHARASINWLISKKVPGLKSETSVDYMNHKFSRIGQNPDYSGYFWTGQEGVSLELSDKHKGEKVSENADMGSYGYENFAVREKLSYEAVIGGSHGIRATALASLNSNNYSPVTYRRRMVSFAADFHYDWKGRYIIEAVASYNGSSSLPKGNRFGFFPAAGAAWVISEEGFMDGAAGVDFLKIYVSGGMMGYENYADPYMGYDSYTSAKGNTFGPYSENPWFGVNTESSLATSIMRFGNASLSYERRKEASAGVESRFLNDRLSLNASYYHIVRDGIRTKMTSNIAGVFGLKEVDFYDNYNTNVSDGLELSIGWKDKVGDFTYSVSANATYNSTIWKKYEEMPVQPWLQTEGTRYGRVLGYTCIGRYESDEDIAGSPENTLYSGISAGDLKYKDINKDGRIDPNDRSVIGNTSPKWMYSLNLFLKYKWIDLSVIGVGNAGVDIFLTNEYFWNGWGYGNVSEWVIEHAGKDIPAVTYYKNTNNCQVSDFWKRDGGWFKLAQVELGSDIPLKQKKNVCKGLRVYLRGNNLLTVSGVEDIDPVNKDAGVTQAPLFRSLALGLQVKF